MLKRCIIQLIVETRRVSEAPDEKMLKQLRALEVKMGLVLTLVRLSTNDDEVEQSLNVCVPTIQQFKASVWAVINEQPMADMSGGYSESVADDTARE